MAFLPAIAVPALTAGAAASTAAAGIAAFAGARQQAKYQKQAYEQQSAFQTQLAERNARLIEIEGRAAADALSRDRMRRLGRSRAMAGASGTEISGSPLDSMADEAGQYGRDLAWLQYNTAVKRQDAILGGQIASRRETLGAINAKITGDQAFGSILGGFGQAGAIASGYDWSTL